MKRIIAVLFVAVLMVFSLTACDMILNSLMTDPTEPPSIDPTDVTTAEPTDEPIVLPTDAFVIEPEFEPIFWENEDNAIFAGEIATVDMDMDGREEVIRYEPVEDESEIISNLFVGERMIQLGFYYPETACILDADPNDGSLDLLLDGDACSSDYVIFHLRIVDGELTEVGCVYGGIIGIEAKEIVVSETVDRFGTWGAFRRYGFDRDGILVPLSDALYMDESELDEIFEYPIPDEEYAYVPYIYALQPVTVTIDGEETTLPEGTKLYPTFFEPDGTTGFVTHEGVRGTMFAYRTEEYGAWFVGGVEEYELFGGVNYAG